MFGNINMDEISKMMNKMQDGSLPNADSLLKDDKVFEAKSGGGLVVVKMQGNFEITDICIDDSLMDDKDSLQILVMSSLNEVIKLILEDKKTSIMSSMGNLMGNMNPKQ